VESEKSFGQVVFNSHSQIFISCILMFLDLTDVHRPTTSGLDKLSPGSLSRGSTIAVTISYCHAICR